MRAVGAGGGPPGSGPEEGILDVVIIAGHCVQVLRNSISHTGPHDLQDLVTKTVDAVSRIADICVVERSTAIANKVSPDVSKGGLRITGRRKANPLVTGVQLQRPNGVFGKQHYAAIVRDRRRERLR